MVPPWNNGVAPRCCRSPTERRSDEHPGSTRGFSCLSLLSTRHPLVHHKLPRSEPYVLSDGLIGLLIPVLYFFGHRSHWITPPDGPRHPSRRGCLLTNTGYSPVLLAPMIAFAVQLPPLTPLPFSPQAYPTGKPLLTLLYFLAFVR